MPGRGAELPDHLFPFLVVGSGLTAGQIPQVQGDIPVKRRTTSVASVFRLSNGLGQTLAPGLSQVRTNVRAAQRPYPEFTRVTHGGQ